VTEISSRYSVLIFLMKWTSFLIFIMSIINIVFNLVSLIFEFNWGYTIFSLVILIVFTLISGYLFFTFSKLKRRLQQQLSH